MRNNTRRILLTVGSSLLIALGGCSADPGVTEDRGDAHTPDVTATESAATAAATEEAATECLATPESAASIAEGLTVTGGGSLRDAFAVPLIGNPDFGFVVAAEIDGPGWRRTATSERGQWVTSAEVPSSRRTA